MSTTEQTAASSSGTTTAVSMINLNDGCGEYFVDSGLSGGIGGGGSGHEEDEDYLDDDSELGSLEGSAFQSRLAPDKMSPEEMKAFHDVIENTSQIPLFLFIRNNILKFWYENPKVQLMLENVCCRIEPPFNSDRILISRIFYFLERYGLINFGVFHLSKAILLPMKPKIIVIGAGIAGLIAARQLKHFGFDVFVVESRNRIGGRVSTYKHGKYLADVGATVITGLGGNPLRVLLKQINMKLKRINQKCPLFATNSIIDKSKDEIMESVFNLLLEGTSILSHKMNFNKIGNRQVSLGESLDIVLELQERDVKKKYLKHLNDIAVLEETLSKNLDQLKGLQNIITSLYDKHREFVQSKVQQRNATQEYAFRLNRYDLNQAISKLSQLKENIKRTEDKIRELESMDIAAQYLSPLDRRILDWHFANLEFATTTSLSNLSLQHWDQDDDNEFTGPQFAVKNGYSCLPYSLAEGIDVKLNSVVRSVRLTATGAEVQVVNIEKFTQLHDSKNLSKKLTTSSPVTFQADAVLCTLPLGVLKNSVEGSSSQAESKPNSIEFIPPLPEYKVQSIKRLGYGNLNKVVLIFDQIFWDKNIHLFGHVATTPETRGELFLFWSVYKQPVLMALIAGDAANKLEQVEDEIIKTRCLSILNNIFPTVSNLKSYYVTRWKSDPWSLGSFSYVATGSTGDDYDLLSEPVLHPTKNPSDPVVPRLFFAGEHTIRNYPATVHGALLSGVRESAKIANQFLGCPYLKKN